MTDTIARHRWTKDELAHLNRTVSHSKNKQEAFKKIAQEMGLSPQAVQGTYYNHKRAPQAKTGRVGRPAKASFQPARATTPTIDVSSLSESELFAMAEAIKNEVSSRAELLIKASDLLKA